LIVEEGGKSVVKDGNKLIWKVERINAFGDVMTEMDKIHACKTIAVREN
jgi:hypothetical protein